VDWLENHFEQFPIGGGWKVTGVRVDGEAIRLSLRVTDKHGATIRQLPLNDQARWVSVVCPSEKEEVWKLLGPNQRLVVQATDSVGTVATCDCKAPVNSPVSSSQTQPKTQQLIGSLWANPRELCDSLREYGLPSQGWQQSIGGVWFGSTDHRDIGEAGRILPTNLELYVYGYSERRAVKVQLVLNVHNPTTRQIGLATLAEAAKVLAKKFAFEPSDTLELAIKQTKSFSHEDPKLRIVLKTEQTRIETFVVEFSDPSEPIDRVNQLE
jgi:hypothetical protein